MMTNDTSHVGNTVLHLDSEIMSEGVDELNDGKVGHPFVYSDACFMAAALFKNTVDVAYRQLQRIIEICLEGKDTPKFSGIWKRINKIRIEDSDGKTWFADGKTKTEVVFLAGALDRPQTNQSW